MIGIERGLASILVRFNFLKRNVQRTNMPTACKGRVKILAYVFLSFDIYSLLNMTRLSSFLGIGSAIVINKLR